MLGSRGVEPVRAALASGVAMEVFAVAYTRWIAAGSPIARTQREGLDELRALLAVRD